MVKIISKIEEKSTPSPTESNVVLSPNQSDLSDVDSSTPGADKKYVQAELRYFDPHLDLSHSERKVVTVGRDVYYQNMILFVQLVWG